jgi:hypothetical protein
MRAFYYQHGQTVWREALDQLLDPAVEITATSLGRLKSFVIGKFEDRAQWTEKDIYRFGLPGSSHAAKRQLLQVQFRAHDEAMSNICNRGHLGRRIKPGFTCLGPSFPRALALRSLSGKIRCPHQSEPLRRFCHLLLGGVLILPMLI